MRNFSYNGSYRQGRGFTLIEIMAAIGILSIMTAFVLVSFSGARVRRELEGASREVASVIREAQNNALTGKRDASRDDNRVCYYMINAQEGSNQIGVHIGSTDPLAGSDCTESTDTYYQLKNGIRIRTGGSQMFYFTLPHARVYRFPANTELLAGSIDLPLIKNSLTYHVCVYPGGRIEERGGSAC